MKSASAMLALALLAACGRENQGADKGRQLPDRAGPTPAERTPVQAPAERLSQYSSLGKDNCNLVESSDEGPYWRMRCRGIGGYDVDYSESDLRQGIAVIARDGTKADLDLSSKIAKGAFNTLGGRIEWRGEAAAGPESLIVRVNVARQDGGPDRSLLAVAALSPTPCIIGAVEPGADQNIRAQALADKGGPCLS